MSSLYVNKQSMSQESQGQQKIRIPSPYDFNLKYFGLTFAAQMIVSMVISSFDDQMSYRILNYFINLGCLFAYAYLFYLAIEYGEQKRKFVGLWPYLAMQFIIMSGFNLWIDFYAIFDFSSSYTGQIFCVLVADIFLFAMIQADKTIDQMIKAHDALAKYDLEGGVGPGVPGEAQQHGP